MNKQAVQASIDIGKEKTQYFEKIVCYLADGLPCHPGLHPNCHYWAEEAAEHMRDVRPGGESLAED